MLTWDLHKEVIPFFVFTEKEEQQWNLRMRWMW